jgi:hypothetical protein
MIVADGPAEQQAHEPPQSRESPRHTSGETWTIRHLPLGSGTADAMIRVHRIEGAKG